MRYVCTDDAPRPIRFPICEYHGVLHRRRSRSHGDKIANRSNYLLDRPSIESLKRMNDLSHRLCVAPMMDWTDRHCRYFLRLISRHARLYTEMITAPRARARRRAAPPRLRSGRASARAAAGRQRSARARASRARSGERWGYDEINLNCGCPSERVQTGSFGACLMAEPALVADCVQAMRDAVSIPVTVKHRIGLDASEDYGFVRDFVGTVAAAGLRRVHRARAQRGAEGPVAEGEPRGAAAALRRRAPAQARVSRADDRAQRRAHRLALRSSASSTQVDGVMLGRVAYHDP